MQKKTPLVLGWAAVALFAAGCSTPTAPSAPPTEASAAPTTESPTTEATPQVTNQPPAEKPTRVDPEILPDTIADWKLDEELVYYARGDIRDDTNEIVAINVEPDVRASEFVELMDNVEEVAGGYCGRFSGAVDLCVMDGSTYSMVVIQGEGLEQGRQIAEVVFPLL